MNGPLVITLDTTPALAAQLAQLQIAFAEVCNAIAPVVQETRCWNRVALHHIVYRNLRERFPQLGSQLVCNAIYSVSRTCRIVFQSPGSPFSVNRQPERPLPQLKFAATAPVYFDRHTLSIRDGVVSMVTLDGRIRFRLSISAADEQRFREEKLREIVLSCQGGRYQLGFTFAAQNDKADMADEMTAQSILPEYVVLLESGHATRYAGDNAGSTTGNNADHATDHSTPQETALGDAP